MMEDLQSKDLENYQRLVRPELARVLRTLRLENIYVSGDNDILYHQKNNQSVAVSDFLGGFGSTILGHNHPEILNIVQELKDQKKPQHAQGSLKKESADLAVLLNSIVKEKLKDERDFITTLSNTGTEAVEIALKHSLLEWNDRRERTIFQIKTKMFRSKAVPKELLDKVNDYCARLETLKPIMLSLEKSFHGKTSGAVALTANSAYRKMYDAAPVGVTFFGLNEIESMIKTIKDHDCNLIISPDLTLSFNSLAGFIYEPIQGEGGIEEVPEDFIRKVSRELKVRQIPMICDEIQSGCFRTGKFLTSEWFSMQPDYILLGKSLGGGVAKIAATMIAKDHYVDEFGWIHTSTFAEDDWSSVIALKSLNLLIKEEKQIALKASQFEQEIKNCVDEIKKKYPNILKGVKGRGFFLGVEFNFDSSAPLTDLLMGLYEHGHATYVYTSYLLHHHNVRVGVTLSAPEIVRLEPSAFVTDASIVKLKKGLHELCRLLFERKTLALTSHMWDEDFTQEQLDTVSDLRSPIIESNLSNETHIGFLTHVVTPVQAQSLDRVFVHVKPAKLEKFFKNYANQSVPFRYFQKTIKGTNGKAVVLNLYGVMQPSSFFEDSLRTQNFKAFKIVQDAVNLAHSHGMKYFGLGQFTSIVSENGMLLNNPGMPITTGNSLTAAMAVEAVKVMSLKKKIDLKKAKIGIVGFTGNICNVLTQIIADEATQLVLIHRGAADQLEKYEEAVTTLMKETNLKRENLTIGFDLNELKACEIVVVGTNSATEIIQTEHIKENAIVLDISVPSNVQSAVKKRPDVSYFQGGLARLPFDQIVDHEWVPLKTGDLFACMTETIVLGLQGIDESYSLGKLNKAQVLESLKLAKDVGVTLGGLKKF